MRKKLKTFTVLVACNVSAYKPVTVRATSVEHAERRVRCDIGKNGFESHYYTSDEPWETDWQQADDLRVVEDSTEEVTP